MNRFNEIVNKVKKGMLEAYKDTCTFTDNPAEKFGAEYLFTVNVAKEIGRLNGPDVDPFNIKLEHDVSKLATDCLPLIKRGNPFIKGQTILRRGTPIIERTGRVDIAIYCDAPALQGHGNIPFCVIELKSFNPTKKPVIADLQRIAEFIKLSGPTGKSFLKYGAFSAVHDIKKIDSENNIYKKKESIRNTYEKWISKTSMLDGLDISVDEFKLSKDTEERLQEDTDGYYIDVDAKHCFIGIIITIKSMDAA